MITADPWAPVTSAEAAELTWRPVSPTSNRARLTHAIRGAHTLCGIAARTTSWADADTETTEPARCPECAAVPEGHVTHLDIRALGLTGRQVDYWTERGWLRTDDATPGTGHRRTFAPTELRVAAVMLTLTEAGLSPEAAHRAARNRGRLSPTVRVYMSACSPKPSSRPSRNGDHSE